MDTEFVRERTWFPRPALLQVSAGDEVWLVDPLRVADWAPFARLLEDPSVVKVLHAVSEDLEVFELLTGASPRNLFDTQLAGAFAGHGYSLGYRGLVEALLEVSLDKGETRSDWLRRPLSPAQLRYAALDVTYLLPMHGRLSGQLDALGRSAWMNEELDYQRRAKAADKRPEAAYLRIRNRDQLRPADHAVLRALCAWRESEAMARDLPRRHLMTDDILMQLAAAESVDAKALDNMQGLGRRTAARYADAIRACVEKARRQGPEAVDSPVDLRPHAGTIKRLKRIVRQEAEILDMPPELLANRRALESLLVSVLDTGEAPVEFQGWRSEVITEKLIDCIHESN